MKKLTLLLLALLLAFSCVACQNNDVQPSDGDSSSTTETEPVLPEDLEERFVRACIAQESEWMLTQEEMNAVSKTKCTRGYTFFDLDHNGTLAFIVQRGNDSANIYYYDASADKIVRYTDGESDAYTFTLDYFYLCHDTDVNAYYNIMRFISTDDEGGTFETWNRYYFNAGKPDVLTAWSVYRNGDEKSYTFMDYDIEADDYDILVEDHLRRNHMEYTFETIEADAYAAMSADERAEALRASYEAFTADFSK